MNTFVAVENPEAYLRQLCAAQRDSASEIVCLRYDFEQYYLKPATRVSLAVVVECCHGAVSGMALGEWQDNLASSTFEWRQGAVRDWAAHNAFAYFSISDPVRLEPISIPKPWGQEIWYTGIEERGQSRVTDGRYSVPLPWLLSVLPDAWVGGRHRDLNLLKILDPLPEAVYGDLYFEQHEEKQEVYVVTHVDEQAWPGGIGGICIGFDPAVRGEFSSDEACKAAFASAVEEYESVRREIDALLDQCRRRDGVAINAPVMANVVKGWIKDIPESIRDKEEKLRHQMDRFKGVAPLQVGDVLKVPTHTPHSLMHGVRTIEFQTPVYERQIIAFAQKVLTQEHWDTKQALDTMQLDVPGVASLRDVEVGQGYRIEEVVDFDTFYAWRLTLEPGESYLLSDVCGYALAIGVSGRLSVAGQVVKEEDALLIPASLESARISNQGAFPAVILLSFPK